KLRLKNSARSPVCIVMFDFVIVFLKTRIQIVKRQNEVFAPQTDQGRLVIGLRIEQLNSPDVGRWKDFGIFLGCCDYTCQNGKDYSKRIHALKNSEMA